MCHADDALPPRAPTVGAIADAHDLILEAADGNRFLAFEAHPAEPGSTGVVIFPDVRGLHNFYRELARQFAAAGHHAVVFDYFGRTEAGLGERGDDFDYKPLIGQLTPDGIDADCRAAVAHLHASAAHVTTVVSVGFCMGGSASWRQSARDTGIDGCMGLYGIPDRVRGDIASMKKPLLILVAGADMTPIGEFKRFDKDLTDAGVTHRMVTYDGAPHSYFDRHFAEWTRACDDSWNQMLTFISEVSVGTFV